MVSTMSLFFNIVALLVSAKSLEVLAASCCLRTSPMHRLRDGLDLQNSLIRNKHQDFMFLPNAAALASSSENFSEKFILAESMIQLMVQRDSLEVMEETAIMSVHGKLMDAVISDSCKYLSELLEYKINCYNQQELQILAKKLEIYRSVKTLHSQVDFQGSPKNRYAYWDENVVKSCTPYTCPRLQEIRRLMGFVPNADVCSCS